MVNRFVDSADSEYRGYDLTIGEVRFLCGQIGVKLGVEAEATINDVLARSAPDAEVIHQAVPPAEASYIVGVPEGDEWATAQALREDPDVEIASLIGSGETGPVPDTAMEVVVRRLASRR